VFLVSRRFDHISTTVQAATMSSPEHRAGKRPSKSCWCLGKVFTWTMAECDLRPRNSPMLGRLAATILATSNMATRNSIVTATCLAAARR
jgi:hypothetical protein